MNFNIIYKLFQDIASESSGAANSNHKLKESSCTFSSFEATVWVLQNNTAVLRDI